MKRYASIIIIFSILFFNHIDTFVFQAKAYDDIETNTMFELTAYYSPVPNQKHYYTGNYESEIRLNGKGLRGASGKDVFPGMFAAPKSYPFGTKIYIEGIGIGEVADRGGSIVKKGKKGNKFDRIDVWMGYGDEGLARTLKFGRKTLNGKILKDDSIDVKLDLSIFKKDFEYLKKFSVSYEKGNNVTLSEKNKKNNLYAIKEDNKEKNNNSVFNYYINPNSSDSLIKEFQKRLKNIGIYKGKVDGNYLSVRNTIVRYQLQTGVIKDKKEDGAGYTGPKTREFLNKHYISYKENRKNLKKEIENNINKKYSIGYLEKGYKGKDVEKLQKILKELGYYNADITGNFQDETKKALIKYQKRTGIIKTSKEDGAGYFGPKTITQIKKDLKLKMYNEKLELV